MKPQDIETFLQESTSLWCASWLQLTDGQWKPDSYVGCERTARIYFSDAKRWTDAFRSARLYRIEDQRVSKVIAITAGEILGKIRDIRDRYRERGGTIETATCSMILASIEELLQGAEGQSKVIVTEPE